MNGGPPRLRLRPEAAQIYPTLRPSGEYEVTAPGFDACGGVWIQTNRPTLSSPGGIRYVAQHHFEVVGKDQSWE